MNQGRLSPILQQFRHPAGSCLEASDSDLLHAYTRTGDQDAFTALVRRHGPMVWRVCRRAARGHQEAEDAFQASFLVLARRASAISWRESIGPWLFTVAKRVTAKQHSPSRIPPVPERSTASPLDEMSARELLSVLDEEVARLPEAERGPVVLCLVEDQTREEAARQLGLSVSTVRRRLEDGKKRLQARLRRRGLAPATVLPALRLSETIAPPVTVLSRVVEGPASANAVLLAQQCSVSLTKWKACAALLLVVVLGGLGLAACLPVNSPDLVRRVGPIPAETPNVDALGDPLPAGAVLRLGTIRFRQQGSCFTAVYSHTGKWLASAGWWHPSIQLWDASNGKEVRTFLGSAKGHSRVCFSPDDRLLVAAGLDGMVYRWDTETGTAKGRLEGHKNEVRGLSYAARGERLATCDEKVIRVWDATGKSLQHIESPGGGLGNVALAPDGTRVAAGGQDKVVRIWDVGSGAVVQELRGHTSEITDVTYSPDGSLLFTLANEQTLIWDAITGMQRGKQNTPGERGRRLTISPDGKLVASGSDNGRVRITGWPDGKERIAFPALSDYIRALSFSPDGKTLAVVGDGSAIRLWDTTTGKDRQSFPGHEERLVSVAYSPDGQSILTSAWDGSVRLWDAQTGKEQRTFHPNVQRREGDPRRPASLAGVAFSGDGSLVSVVCGENTVVIWDRRSGKEIRRFYASTIAFAPQGKMIALGEVARDLANVICLRELDTGKLIRELRGHLTPIQSVRFTPDGKTLISRAIRFEGLRTGEPGESETRFLRIWNVATGQEHRSPAVESVYPKGLTPDGRMFVQTEYTEKNGQLWEIASGQKRCELRGHTEMIFDVAFAPGGRLAASASMDGTIRLWELPAGKEIAQLKGHRSWVLSVAFSADGQRLVSGSLDTTALVWDMAPYQKRARERVSLSPQELARCWTDLAGKAPEGHRAVSQLVSAEETVGYLRGKLPPVPEVDKKRLAQLIADLGSAQFATREQASNELAKLGDLAEPALRGTLSSGELEVTMRAKRLLKRLQEQPLSAEGLRTVRAIEVLEYIGDDAARRLLGQWARGAAGAHQTREARTALDRLEKR